MNIEQIEKALPKELDQMREAYLAQLGAAYQVGLLSVEYLDKECGTLEGIMAIKGIETIPEQIFQCVEVYYNYGAARRLVDDLYIDGFDLPTLVAGIRGQRNDK